MLPLRFFSYLIPLIKNPSLGLYKYLCQRRQTNNLSVCVKYDTIGCIYPKKQGPKSLLLFLVTRHNCLAFNRLRLKGMYYRLRIMVLCDLRSSSTVQILQIILSQSILFQAHYKVHCMSDTIPLVTPKCQCTLWWTWPALPRRLAIVSYLALNYNSVLWHALFKPSTNKSFGKISLLVFNQYIMLCNLKCKLFQVYLLEFFTALIA